MHPKPFLGRLVERKAVTIIAGFKSHEGIVICADTEESSEHSKRNVPKLRFESSSKSEGNDLAVAFCGSSNSGAFVDKLTENAWESVQSSTSLDEACAEIEKSIKSDYKEYGKIFQTGSCPSADLIYGVKMFNGTRLFTAQGPLINEKNGYDTAGIGYYLADFICGRMYKDYLSLRQCVILAAYMLFQAKEHVPGCGGDSHIAVIRNNGVSGLVDWHSVDCITDLLKMADSACGRVLFNVADLELTDDEFKKQTAKLLDMLSDMRRDGKSELLDSWKFWDRIEQGLSGKEPEPRGRDLLGFPLDNQ